MSWRDHMGPALFRGVPFFVDAAELAGGRKTVVHEYPQRDIPFVEDLGRRGRGFQIDGYVLGEEYLTARDVLIGALEQPGPGTLVHPYHGTRLVAVLRFTVRDTRRDGGYAQFAIDFAETPAQPFSPSIVASPPAQTGTAADAAQGAAQRHLLASYRIRLPLTGAPGLLGAGIGKALPQFTLTSVQGLVSSFSTSLHVALKPFVRGIDQVAAMKRLADAIVFEAGTLVRTPLSLATRLGDLIKRLASFPTTPRLGVRGLVDAYHFTSSTTRPPASTVTRQYEQANYDSVDRFVRRTVAAEAGRLVAAAAASATPSFPVFDSYEEAIEVRDQVLELLDAEADAATTDDMYAALVQLRAEVIAAVPTETVSLPHLIRYTPTTSVPALVLAHRLYGDIALTDDLVRRNRVRHPGFVLGGRALQVVSHA